MLASTSPQRNLAGQPGASGVTDAQFKLAWLNEIVSEGVVRQRFLPPHAGGPPVVPQVASLGQAIIDGSPSAGGDAGAETVNAEPSSSVRQGAHVPSRASSSWLQAPLRECARNVSDDGALARSLLDAGAATDDTDREGRSPLHWAASRGNTHVVRALVDAGANINARDRTGKTPLHYARSPSTVEALVDCCGRVLTKNSAATATSAEGLLVGGAAAAAGAGVERSMVAEECVAIVDARNAYGSTALHRAAFNGREGVVVALIKGGAGVGVLGKSGRSALHLACRNAHAGCVEILLVWGADESAPAKDGSTPWDELADAAETRAPDDANVDRAAFALRRARGGRAWQRRGWLLMLKKAVRSRREAGLLADGRVADAGVSEKEEVRGRGVDVYAGDVRRGDGAEGGDLARLVYRLLESGEEGFFRQVVGYV